MIRTITGIAVSVHRFERISPSRWSGQYLAFSRTKASCIGEPSDFCCDPGAAPHGRRRNRCVNALLLQIGQVPAGRITVGILLYDPDPDHEGECRQQYGMLEPGRFEE